MYPHPARHYRKLTDDKVQCMLCPHKCILHDGATGTCRVRKNTNGSLVSLSYGKVSATHFDPIEKKPLYHYFPGSVIFSVGGIGCNLHCRFCQNWEISQSSPEDYLYLKDCHPEALVEEALGRPGNIGIAYTYNEPTVWHEFMADIAFVAKNRGLKNVMVSNGFINPEPLAEILPLIDAFNIDLKGFSDDFYKKYTSSRLEPVKETIRAIHRYGRHLEITNLVVTGINDDPGTFEQLVQWIAAETARDVPLHISRYYPVYRMANEATSPQTLRRFYDIAKARLDHVYLGNLRSGEGQDTCCPACKNVVIERSGYSATLPGLDARGVCRHCGTRVLNPASLPPPA